MHSLKNTLIAVGLLGLSFVLYQASSTNSDDTDLIAAHEISEGGSASSSSEASSTLAEPGASSHSSQLSMGSGTTSPPSFGSAPKLDLPMISTPISKPTAPELAGSANSNFGSGPASFGGSAGNAGSQFETELEPPLGPNSSFNPPPAERSSTPPSSAPADAMNPSLQGPANSGFGSGFANDPSNTFQPAPVDPPVNLTPSAGNVARDEGLIDALEYQKKWQANQFVAAPSTDASREQPAPASGFAPNSVDSTPNATNGDGDSGFPFASQPIPSADSSYNQLATDRSSNDSGFGVAQADMEPSRSNLSFQAVWPEVDKLVAAEQFREALQLLSGYYHSPDLTGPQRQRLIGWLDALAGKVIFSTENHLETASYTVANETLADLGQRWKIPAQLIYNINQENIPNVAAVAPGTQIKVVPGPFRAEVDREQSTLTLFLGELYAGRYPVRVGISGAPKPGAFQVLVKAAEGHNWRDAEGLEYPPTAPENGYGPYWIGLSGSLCIHAVPESTAAGHHGCLGLSEKDAKDVFAILAEGSTVKIIR